MRRIICDNCRKIISDKDNRFKLIVERYSPDDIRNDDKYSYDNDLCEKCIEKVTVYTETKYEIKHKKDME